MGSRFTAQFIRFALSDYRHRKAVRDLIDAYPSYRRPALNLASAFHYLALDGETELARHYPSTGGDGDAMQAWAAASTILARDSCKVENLFRGQVQTNEPARSMPILGGVLALATKFALPIRLFEIGASAGLNLRFDHYRYVASDWEWGNPGSQLTLRNRIHRGRPRNVNAAVHVVERRGCDLMPLDAANRETSLRLQSFVWPDQIDRLNRLRAALDVASQVPLTIEAQDFLTWLPREANPRAGHLTVVIQTVVEEHLYTEQRSRLGDVIAATADRASAAAPLAYLRMELQGGAYLTSLKTWPDASYVPICHSDGHGQDISWI